MVEPAGATPPPSLIEAVRELLAGDGRPPSRARVAAWIRAGAVRVEGRRTTDPDRPVERGARISVDLDDMEAAGVRSKAPTSSTARPTPPPWLLHRDRALTVVDRAAFAPELSGPGLAAAVAAALAQGAARERGPGELVCVPDPTGPGSGPVLLCASKALAARLAAEVRAGRVTETLLALRSGPQLGVGETPADEGAAQGPRLVVREQAPLGPAPAGARDLLPPHRAALVLKHPRTNRRLAFACEPPPTFLEACATRTKQPPDPRYRGGEASGG